MAGFFPVGNPNTGGIVQADIKMKVAASTDVTVGDALDIDSSGYLQLANSGDAVVAVAAESVTGAASTYPWIPVYLVTENRLFYVATGTTAPAQTDIGEKIDISVETTGAYVVDPATTTNGDFLVLGLDYDNTPTESKTFAIGDQVIGVFAHRLADYDS